MMRRGSLFVISGPSGVGKGTLVARVLREIPNVWVSVSVTTRRPRAGEEEGKTYFFIDETEFHQLKDNEGLLEWAKVHDCYYGTPRAKVEEALSAGKLVVLEIDVQGAFQVRESFPEAHLIFIEPPSLEELRERLVGRNTESQENMEARLKTAALELSHKMAYDVQLVNDDIDQAVQELVAYMNNIA